MHAARRFRYAFSWVLAGPLALGGGCGRDETPGAPPTGSVVPTVMSSAIAASIPDTADPETVSPLSTSSSAGRDAAATQASATQPAATQPVAPPAPLSPCRQGIDQHPGQWAIFTALDGRQLRYEVIEVTSEAIVTRVEVFQDGRPLGLPATRRDVCASDIIPPPTNKAPVDRRVTASRCRAARRDWSALCYEDRWMDEEIAYVRRTWVSDDAPVFGLVRMELHGDDALEARFELADWGPRH